MRIYLWLFLVLGFLISGSAFAQTDLTGTWQGKMEISPDQKLTIQFLITKKDDGSYSAVLNSPDTGGLKDIPADTVSYKDGTLNLEVTSLSGSYSGKVEEGVITGKWEQPGGVLDLVLTPYVKPKEVPTDPLLGEWVGKLAVQGLNLTVVFRYNKNEGGNFTGFLDIPEQNAKDLPVTDVTLAGDEVNFAVTVAQLKYRGNLDGEKIIGHLIQGNNEMALDFEKGKYEPPPRNLDISEEIMKKVKGEWVGQLTFVKDIPLPIKIRFEETKEGKSRAFMDSPNENMKDMELSDVELKDDKLSLKTSWSRYEGTLKDNTIEGNYIIGNMKFELNLTKDAKIELIEPQIDISADMMEKLSGSWKGNVANTEIVLTFKTGDDGKKEILVETPATGVPPSSPFLKVSIADNKLSLKATSFEFIGDLKEEKIEGVRRQLGGAIPITLTKEK